MKLAPWSSLRVKVVLVILITTALALALASVGFVAYEYRNVRDRAVVRFGALASVVGSSCRAALVFGDAGAAESALASVAADPRVVAATIWTVTGEPFARFARAGESAPESQVPAPDDHIFAPHRLTLARSITHSGQRVGTIRLIADLTTVEQQIRGFVRTGVAVGSLALLVAALLAIRLQRLVTGPVLRLAAATRAVAEHGDYSVRVPRTSGDEVGQLVDSFNNMLARVDNRDRALRESEERYAVAVGGSRDGIWDWDLHSGQVHYSARWREMLGCGEGELGTDLDAWLGRVHPEDRERVRRGLDDHLGDRSPHFEAEYRMRHRDGHWVWLSARGLAVRDPAGRPSRMAGSQTDVTDRMGRDGLTGLPNRLLFADRVDRALDRRRRERVAELAVLCVELEQLKAVNESLGRAAGRALLVAAAERIAGAVGPRDTLARLDVGEFAILIEDLRGPAHAARVAARIHDAIAPAFRLGEQEVFTSAAIGIALGTPQHAAADELLRDADVALERSRNRGWNQTEVFDEAMRERATARLELESSLRRAVEAGRFELHYQPIVTLEGGRLAGVEALARWRRENGEAVAPREFIGLAEETGIIVPLGSWILRRALEQLRDWRAEHAVATDLVLTVNVSGRQLARLELVDEVREMLAEFALPPRLLKLELTETTLVDDIETATVALRAMDQLGVGLWLDDFGTGYSSLSYLHRFPLEALKIDRSFVVGLDGEQRDFVGTLIELARGLGMKSVAEGVETSSQLERLTALRCDFAQGHFVSLPLDSKAMTQLLGRAVP